MKQKLSYMSERQSVLAQNIANADTPGYKAKDVKEPDFKKLARMSSGTARKLQLMTTNERHIHSKDGSSLAFRVETRKTTDELNPDANNVVVEEEMSKVATNQADYQKVINLYGKAVSMFKTAIGNPNTGS